jgi:hypothetical protein
MMDNSLYNFDGEDEAGFYLSVVFTSASELYSMYVGGRC